MRIVRLPALLFASPLVVLACASNRRVPPPAPGYVAPPPARYGIRGPSPVAPAPAEVPVPVATNSVPVPPPSAAKPDVLTGPPPAERPSDIPAVVAVPANKSPHPQRHTCAGETCEKRCDPSEPLACVAAGEQWVGMTSHIDQRQKYLAVGCGAGHAESCLDLVRACVGLNRFTRSCREGLEGGLRRQKAPEVNNCGGDGCDQGKLIDVAKQRLSRAVGGRCQQGSGRDCMVLAKHHDFVQRDAKLASRYYRRACDLGEPRACQATASMETDVSKKQSLDGRAHGLYMAWCERGMASDCAEASDAFARGVGTTVHLDAARWYAAKACQLGKIRCR